MKTSPACDTLALVAAVLNSRLSPGSSWRTTGDPLAQASREAGRLERVTLWKALEEDLPGADFSVDDLPAETAATILEHLNRHHAEPGTAWYSFGLQPNAQPRGPMPGPEFLEVLGHIDFWKLTDAAAEDAELLS
ncbi:hypothetical protein [Streptosporangium roseum]|uniref:hypothetical protein n=1 Tax=Streptosporangium roseum TaxID=2001 RepID=UPI003325DB84